MDYQEKLRLAKKALDSGSYDKKTIEYLFPELKESEDERIRKWLIGVIKSNEYGNISNVGEMPCSKPNVIAWLEKQGEKANPHSGISFEYNGHTWGMCARDNGVDILLDKQLFKHLENQGEQKQNVIDIISDLENYFATTTKEQQEKDWEEIKEWEEKHFNHNKHIEQKPDWNEEDERMLDKLIKHFDWGSDYRFDKNDCDEAQDWLNSLKKRYTWKPTDEQMETLKEVVRLYKSTHFDSGQYKIETLYEDLKKLKEK